MASPSHSGFALEQQESRPPRRRHYVITDESGARSLPTDDDYDAVEPPSVSQRRARDCFGIGFGLGIAALGVAAGLYFGGYVGRPALNPSPAPSTLEPDLGPFEEAQNLEAIALARVAPVKLDQAAGVTLPTELNSPDIRVIEQTPAAPRKPSNEEAAPDPENPY